MMQLPYRERTKRTDNAETSFGKLKPEHEKWMKNGWKIKKHQDQTRNLFLKNEFFRIIFHVVSPPIFDSIFQKNKVRNEIKNESKTVTINNTNVCSTLVRHFGSIVTLNHSKYFYRNRSDP